MTLYLRSKTDTNFKSLAVDMLLALEIFSAPHMFSAAGNKLSLDALLVREHGNSRWESTLTNKGVDLHKGIMPVSQPLIR